MAEFFKREVFSLLLGEELIPEALVEKIAGWRHSGFSVHSKVKARSKEEAERVGKYMIRPLLALDLLPMRRPDANHRFHYRLFRGGPDHELPEAPLHCGQTPAASGRISGVPDGRRGRR